MAKALECEGKKSPKKTRPGTNGILLYPGQTRGRWTGRSQNSSTVGAQPAAIVIVRFMKSKSRLKDAKTQKQTAANACRTRAEPRPREDSGSACTCPRALAVLPSH